MNSKAKRCLSLLMALAICFSLMPSYAFAEEGTASPEEISKTTTDEEIIDSEVVDITIMPTPEAPNETEEWQFNAEFEEKLYDYDETTASSNIITSEQVEKAINYAYNEK